MGRNEHLTGRKRRSGRPVQKPRLGHYLIVTDAEETEKNYFEGLIRSLDEDTQKDIRLEVVRTKTAELIEKCLSLRRSHPVFCECWIVFDRDEVQNFDEIIRMAEEKELHTAWSNPCIEIWFSAYFHSLKTCESSTRCCSDFGELFRQMTGQRYKKSDKNIYRKLSEYGDEEKAIDRARQREKSFLSDAKPSQKLSCTKVYELVEEIKGKVQSE